LQGAAGWPDHAETLERTARAVGVLGRIPLVPAPRITCAIASALAQVSEAPSTVVVAIGSWEGQHAWSPVVVGRNGYCDEPGCTQSFAQKIVRQPLPPAGITRTFRAPQSELGATLHGAPTRTNAMPVDTLSCIHLTRAGTVVEATWRGLSEGASPMFFSMLDCVMARAAGVVEEAFPEGQFRTRMITPAELCVARWLLAGESRQSIAAITARSKHTIGDHIKQLYRKLDVGSVGELGHRLIRTNWDEMLSEPGRTPDGELNRLQGTA